MTDPVHKHPRLIRRGDIVLLKDSEDTTDVVSDVAVVLRLSNGQSDVYKMDEMVLMGEDSDLPPEELIAAVQADAEERAAREARTAQIAAGAAEAIAAAQKPTVNEGETP